MSNNVRFLRQIDKHIQLMGGPSMADEIEARAAECWFGHIRKAWAANDELLKVLKEVVAEHEIPRQRWLELIDRVEREKAEALRRVRE